MKKRKALQLVLIESVRKQLPPPVRIYKDKRRKRDKRIEYHPGPFMEDGKIRNPDGFN